MNQQMKIEDFEVGYNIPAAIGINEKGCCMTSSGDDKS